MASNNRGFYQRLLQRPARSETFADRLNHFWTASLLVLLAIIIGWNYTFRKPISCFCPNHFSESAVEYAESTCWNHRVLRHYANMTTTEKDNVNVVGLEFLQQRSGLPVVCEGGESFDDTTHAADLKEPDTITSITLYQWIPLIFSLQAFLFKLPDILLVALQGVTSISINKLADLTAGFEHMNIEERRLLAHEIAEYVFPRCTRHGCRLPWRYMTLSRLVVKLLYGVNITAQLCLLDRFLAESGSADDSTSSYIQITSRWLFMGDVTDRKTLTALPTHVLCAFDIFETQNVRNYIVQCDISANNFNRAVVVFMWAWFIFVAMVTSISCIVWLVMTAVPVFRKRYLAKALDMTNCNPFYKELDNFSLELGEDGIEVLKSIAANASEILVKDAVCYMWNIWAADIRARKGSNYSVRDADKVSTASGYSGHSRASEYSGRSGKHECQLAMETLPFLDYGRHATKCVRTAQTAY